MSWPGLLLSEVTAEVFHRDWGSPSRGLAKPVWRTCGHRGETRRWSVGSDRGGHIKNLRNAGENTLGDGGGRKRNMSVGRARKLSDAQAGDKSPDLRLSRFIKVDENNNYCYFLSNKL